MRVLWRSLLLLAVLAVGESRYPRLPSVKIQKIQKTTKAYNSDRAVDETVICTDRVPDVADTCVLIYKIGNETNIHAEGPLVNPNCLQFPVSMSTFANKTTEFILAFHRTKVTDDILVGEAEATVSIPEIHGDLKAAWVGERESSSGSKVWDLWMTGVTWTPCNVYIGDNPNPLTCHCNEASCFAIGVEHGGNDNSSIFNCQMLKNEMINNSSETVDVCTESTVPIPITDKGPEISKIRLSYNDETITITAEAPAESTAADVVISWDDDYHVCGPFESVKGNCNISSYTSGDREINILVVGNTFDGAVESTFEKIQDYNLVGTAVSRSTLEMRWTRDNIYKYYWATLLDETHDEFANTEVTCDESLDHCYAYFTHVSGDTHTVSIQPIDDLNGNKIPTNEVVSNTVNMIQEHSIKALHISQIKLSWDSDGSTAEATVCLHHPGNVIVDANAQLLLVDAVGHWYRTHGLTQKEDGFLCFAEVTLDSHLFDLTRKVAVVVTQRDVNGLLVIASGQSDVFFPSVRVENISTHTACAFWSNPGKYNFVIRRTNQPAPLATSLTCSNCFYYLPKSVQMTEEERLVVETEILGMRITAEVPLLLSTAPGDISTVTVDKIVRRSSSDIDICFQEDLSQVSVTHAEVTVIIPSEGSITTEENVGGQATDGSCASFMKLPNIPTDQRVVFELRLYEGTEGSYIQIRRGSIDFVMPDFSTFPVCQFAHKVGDKKMLRLYCSAYGEDTDTILIDGETFTSKDIDGMSPPNTVRYILMKNVVEGTELSFQRTVTGVTVNDELMGQSVEVLSSTLPIHDATTNEPALTSVMLEYDPKQTTVETSPDVTMALADVVNYWRKNDDTYSILPCLSLTPDNLSCAANGYDPGSRKMNVLVVGYKSEFQNEMLTSTKHELQDYGLSGSFITDSTIEMQWTMSADMTYHATLHTVSTENKGLELHFTIADVTCDGSDSLCYVYFLDLTNTSQYKVMIQPKTGGTPNDLNKVVSEKIKHHSAMEEDSAKRILVPPEGYINTNIIHVSWSNPGDQTFTIKRKGMHISLVTYFICGTCSYYLSSQDQAETSLVSETRDTPIKLTSGVTLDMLFSDLPKLHINYLTFPISKDPSGSIVPVIVGARCEPPVPEVSELTLSFILPHDSDAAQYIDSITIDEISEEGNEYCFPNITDFALVAGEVVVMIVAHMNKEAVAVNYFWITLEDIHAAAAKVGKIGEAYEAFRFTFSKSSSSDSVQLDYTSSCECMSSPCYCLGDRVDREPWPLCLNLKFTELEAGTLLHCDDKLQADVVDTDVPVTKVTMTHKDEDKVDILVDVDSAEILNKLEVLFYEVSDTSLTSPSDTCTNILDNECSVTNLEIDKDVTTFSILLVGVDSSEAVLQSTLLSFEDYKVVVQQLTADAVEVRWTASEKTLYKVTVTPDGGAYSDTTVTCGNDESNKCKVYFISILNHDTRTVRVQKNEDGDKNIVASEFALESLATEAPQSATLILRKLNDKTHLSVCLEKQASTKANYTLAIIDQKGTFIDTTGTGTNSCFPELALNTLIMERLRVLVHTEPDDMEEPLVALDTEVYLFADPSSAYSPLRIIQIGARTLKASWENRNRDNLQYELALNGNTSKVQCKAKAECVKYFHLDSTQEPLIINITEKNKGIVQIATVDVPIKDIPVMMNVSSTLQSDNHLRVCFLKPQGAVSYELGIENGSHHLETITGAQVVTESNGLTCIISSGNVDFGALTKLWMLVTAYKNNGSILASGESTWRIECK